MLAGIHTGSEDWSEARGYISGSCISIIRAGRMCVKQSPKGVS
jgi:hypothetical protein